MGKKAQNFHKCLWSGWGGDPPAPPYGQPDRKKTCFIFDDFPNDINKKYQKESFTLTFYIY